jgi:hypothetical protein
MMGTSANQANQVIPMADESITVRQRQQMLQAQHAQLSQVQQAQLLQARQQAQQAQQARQAQAGRPNFAERGFDQNTSANVSFEATKINYTISADRSESSRHELDLLRALEPRQISWKRNAAPAVAEQKVASNFGAFQQQTWSQGQQQQMTPQQLQFVRQQQMMQQQQTLPQGQQQQMTPQQLQFLSQK